MDLNDEQEVILWEKNILAEGNSMCKGCGVEQGSGTHGTEDRPMGWNVVSKEKQQEFKRWGARLGEHWGPW